ncbi:ABC transporter substrate-binding protein [Dongia sp.]|uniref:ABC transporter substrate-binding protein n=1 Tax=Dongia sp. TaxID=1977262 RepID=UPI00375077EE
MSFKGFDRQTYIVDSAKAFGDRRISKREFLRRMGVVGIGFSGFASGLLGNPFRRSLGKPAFAADIALPEDQVKFLKEVGGKYKGATVRYTSEATPPTVVLNQIKDQFTALTGINVEVEIVPLEQVLAKATQDVQGQLGTYDLYYLDQSWVATFSQDCIDPVQYTKDKPDLAMPGFDWDDFSKPLVEGLAKYDGKMVGVPFDIPIFILMYRQDILEKHGIKVPTNYAEFTAAVEAITQAEKANNMFGTGLQAKSGHYSLECDWTQAVWGHGGGIFGADKHFTGNDEAGIKGLQWYQNLLKNAPAASTTSTWDGQFQMMAAGQCALVQSWDEFFPGLDADDSKVKGLWQPAKPLQSEAGLRGTDKVGFGEIPNLGHQGGSIMGLSQYSKNQEAAWIFMQWACSKEIMTQCTLAGGFAPMRISSFADERVKAKAKVMPGTTRHLETVLWTIDNVMASEPDMPLWAGYSNNEIPTELGKLLTGQDYGGDAKKCMDAVAAMIDAKTKDAGLL